MCGIAGFWDPKNEFSEDARDKVLAGMLRTIEHRGPDDHGMYFDGQCGLALGHRRLSIVDLSPLGHQPMSSASGRYVIVYNGEVYNHNELRAELEKSGARFRGHSDTEVLLAAFDQWGIEQSFRRSNGMFAVAIWDREDRVLTLVRDRLGIKPLFYGQVGKVFAFGSELKPLRAIPGFANAINRDALALFMRHNYVPAPYSIFHGLRKLRPGGMLQIDTKFLMQGDGYPDWSQRECSFWSARDVIERGFQSPSQEDEESVVETLHQKLLRAVKYQMVADVPLGAFLSGGVDSSTVVALMQAQSTNRVKTFSIGFHEDGFDEATYARRVASHLQTDHTELYVSSADAMNVIPMLPNMYDEPFSDSSQIPTYLVSKLARQHVTVSLSGDGGDELFAGYPRYNRAQMLWNGFGKIPSFLRDPASTTLQFSSAFLVKCLQLSSVLLPKSWSVENPQQKVQRVAELLRHRSLQDLYKELVSHWKEPSSVVIGGRELPTALTDRSQSVNMQHDIERMMAMDLVSYLPDDILTKVDRASMAVSLEARVPLLDHEVVEYAWQIPLAMKQRGGQNKWVLKKVLEKYLPVQIFDRPKMGFGVPIGSWMRGELRDWVDDLLAENSLRDQGFFDPRPIVQLWQSHRNGQGDGEHLLWDVLIFQAWLAAQQKLATPDHRNCRGATWQHQK